MKLLCLAGITFDKHVKNGYTVVPHPPLVLSSIPNSVIKRPHLFYRVVYEVSLANFSKNKHI